MTKRLYTAEKVLEAVLEDVDDDQDYDDPDEPVMEGSDDEFSDLELNDDADLDQAPPNSPLTPSVASPLPLPPPLSPLPQPSPQSSSPPTSPSSSPSQPAVWTTTLKPVEVKSFNSPVGPTTAIPETPREVFEIFFTDELMTLMVTESNRYAEDVMGSEKFAKWTKITVEEMKAFLGFSILMGINQLPAIKDYWKRNDYLHYSPIADRIPRDRFLEISRYRIAGNFRGRKPSRISRIFDHQRKFSPRNLGRGIHHVSCLGTYVRS